jgi:hypothetical protein
MTLHRVAIALIVVAGCGGGGGNRDTDGAPGTDLDAGLDAGTCPPPSEHTEVTDRPGAALVIRDQPGSVLEADPSIEYPPGAPGGALAYTAVPVIAGTPDQGGLHTRVALSDDEGASWTFVAVANTADAIAPPAGTCPPAAACSATRVHETASIVFDPDEPADDRRWKLFTHRYPVVVVAGDPEAKLYYALGHIALATAPLPSGPWSAPVPLASWPGGDGAGAAFSTEDDPATAGCGALGEPGAAIAPDGSLHLAVACIRPPFDDPTLDIVLLRSGDHGASWQALAVPLTGADGACIGGDGKRVNAADLFTADHREYLIATPERRDQRLGCAVYRFADVASGTLEPAPARLLTLAFGPDELVHYAGACSAAEGAPVTGFTMSHLLVAAGQPVTLHELVSHVPAP